MIEPRTRAMLLAGLGSIVSLLPFLVFSARAGIGTRTDSFFAALAVTQTVQAVLFAPYDLFLLGALLRGRTSGDTALWSALVSWTALSLPAVALLLVAAPAIAGPLFGQAYHSDPALWRHHLLLLAPTLPLNGVLLILQCHSQAIGRLDLPKLAIIAGRGAGLLLAVLLGESVTRWMGVSVLLSAALAGAVLLVVLRPTPAGGALRAGTAAMLREWLGVTRWALLLRTDVLADRALAAHLTAGFLSVFNIGWVAVMSVAEAVQGSFVAADAGRLHAAGPVGGTRQSRRAHLRALVRDSTRAGVAVTLLALCGAAALEAVGARALGLSHLLPGLAGGERVALLLLLAVATGIFAFWKQLAAIYSVQGRASEFARLLVMMYLAMLLPRLAATRAWHVYGFCATMLLYYGGQVALAWWRQADGESLPAAAGAPCPSPPTR